MMEKAQLPLAIVIAAYRRPDCLMRLLRSVELAQYPSGNITLVISLDGPADAQVTAVAESFHWRHGPVRIIKHPQNLGLINHIFFCAGLTEEYGAVILLEDDLLVSPAYYFYALQALNAYSTQEKVAGISLYTYQVSENGFLPFVPVDDGSDVYFMQVPSSWGVLFSNEQWSAFRAFLQENNGNDQLLPEFVRQWPATSWKKIFFRYLIAKNKYIVYPRSALCTNFGDLGTHVLPGGLYQVPLLENHKDFKMPALQDSPALYDPWFELKPEGLNKLIPDFRGYTYEIDLYGTKAPADFAAEFFLTTKNGGQAVRSYGLEMVPAIANVLHNIPGNKIKLLRRSDIKMSTETSNELYGPHQWQRLSGMEGSLSLTVLVACEGSASGLEGTLASINESGPVKEIIVTGGETTHAPEISLPLKFLRTNGKENLFEAMQHASGDIYCWLAPGFHLVKGVIPDVLHVFRSFPQLQCLLGMPALHEGQSIRNVPHQRWTASMIANAGNGSLMQSFLPGCWFFRRDVFKKLMPALKNCTLIDLVKQIGESEKIFTWARVTAKYAGDTAFKNNVHDDLRSGLLHKITRPAFLRDISFLRFFHYELNQFPDVIRKDEKHGTWYMSRY